jgi:hypothetical protein
VSVSRSSGPGPDGSLSKILSGTPARVLSGGMGSAGEAGAGSDGTGSRLDDREPNRADAATNATRSRTLCPMKDDKDMAVAGLDELSGRLPESDNAIALAKSPSRTTA